MARTTIQAADHLMPVPNLDCARSFKVSVLQHPMSSVESPLPAGYLVAARLMPVSALRAKTPIAQFILRRAVTRAAVLLKMAAVSHRAWLTVGGPQPEFKCRTVVGNECRSARAWASVVGVEIVALHAPTTNVVGPTCVRSGAVVMPSAACVWPGTTCCASNLTHVEPAGPAKHSGVGAAQRARSLACAAPFDRSCINRGIYW